jgi:hypothetical protein
MARHTGSKKDPTDNRRGRDAPTFNKKMRVWRSTAGNSADQCELNSCAEKMAAA